MSDGWTHSALARGTAMTALRIALGALLVVGALAKLRRPARVQAAIEAVLPVARAARPLAWALIVAEVALGAWLVSGAAPRAAGAAAALLLGGFAAVLGAARLRGRRRLACACFGGETERPTALVAARALALALVGLAVAVDPPRPSATAALAIAVAVLALLVGALAVLVLALYRQVGVLGLRLQPRTALELAEEGPALGEQAPALDGLAHEGSELVAFLGASCRVCRALEPALHALARDGQRVRIVIDVEDGGAIERWNVPGTPFVALVVDGLVAAKGLVNTLEELEGLVALGERRMAARAGA